MEINYLLLIVLSFVMAISSAFLSIGGALLSTPFFLYFYPNMDIHDIIAISVHLIFFNILGPLLIHFNKQKNLLIENVTSIWFKLIPVIAISCILAILCPDRLLKVILLLLIVIVSCLRSLQLFKPIQIKGLSTINAQLICGSIGGFLGVGGSIFLVPLLLTQKMRILSANAIAAGNTMLVALVTIIIYEINAFFTDHRIYWKIILFVGFFSYIFSRLFTIITYTKMKEKTLGYVSVILLWFITCILVYRILF